MHQDIWLSIGIFIIGLSSLIGFFWTKTSGFGPYNTSTLLLIVSSTLSCLIFISGRFEATTMANIMFAIIGFAGGLFTSKEDTKRSSTEDQCTEKLKGTNK